MTLEAGRCLLLRYDISGPELWHERLVLGGRGFEGWCCAETTLGDIFMEQCSLDNPDIAGMRVLSSQGAPAVGVSEKVVFRHGGQGGDVLRGGSLLLGVGG